MTDEKAAPVSGSILVVGGGISGLTTALEAAEVGYEVFLVEKNPYLGGRVAQLNQYFPKLCPPTCGLEINFKRIKDNPRIKVLTLAEVEKVEGGPGNYTVAVKLNPRYVNENCTCCGACADACQTEIASDFDFGMKKIKAAYLPFAMAFPARFVIAPEIVGDGRRSSAPSRPARMTPSSSRCSRKHSPSTSAPWSGPRGGRLTTPRRWTTSASAGTRTSSPT